MREIKFRGKRVDGGGWICGNLIECAITGKKYIFPTGSDANESSKVCEEGCLRIVTFEVVPETVGQFTGLKDKKGKEIFEGDIFESRASENKADWKRWVCIYQDGSFCFETEIGKRKKKIEQNMLCDDEIKLYGLVVIGNIHENPELMEENNE